MNVRLLIPAAITVLPLLVSPAVLAGLTVTRSIEREYPRVMGKRPAPPPSTPSVPAMPPPSVAGSQDDDGAVDLGALDDPGGGSSPSGDPAASHASGGSSRGYGGTVTPLLKVYFDFVLYLRPNAGDLSFDSFHNLLLFEVMPSPDLTFSFEVRQVPRYFELMYRMSEKLKVRVGKIWIPFDQTHPHFVFGGRTNVSRLTLGSATFLPDVWADLGVALNYQLVDSSNLTLEADAYVVNGFRSGGINPTGDPGEYPSFSTPGLGPDNNRNKAIGGRVSATLLRNFSLGSSLYTGRYNSQGDTPPKYITAVGFDASARFGPAELRAGIAGMTVDVSEVVGIEERMTQFTRGGYYGELGYRFGSGRRWKILGRAGNVQLDSRALLLSDMQIVGAHLLHRMGPFEIGLEHSRDLVERSEKANYTFTALRLVVAL